MVEKVRYSASEVFQFAIRIEENGALLYRRLAEKTEDSRWKEIFTYLADQEDQHRTTFEKLLASLENYQPQEIYPDEYFLYLRSFADNIIFTSQTEKELAAGSGITDIIDFAIRRELDSIMYYLETKPLVPPGQQNQVEKIIEEERRHFLQLSELRKKY